MDDRGYKVMNDTVWYDNVFCNLKFFVNSETVLNLLRLSSKIDAKVIAKKKNRTVDGLHINGIICYGRKRKIRI